MCILCGGRLVHRFDVHGYGIADCGSCGHRQAEAIATLDRAAHVHRTYGDAYFSGGGAGYPDYLAEAGLLRRRGRRYGGLLAKHAPARGPILDVGAAAGFIAAGFRDSGWDAHGVEPNDSMATHARRVLGLDVRTGTLESYASETRFDAVSIIQVAAHFVDPGAAFGAAAALSRPGALLLIETWNRSSLTARVLGRRWHEYSPPSVLHWFNPDSLGATLDRHGYDPVQHGRTLKWIAGSHARSLLRHRGLPAPLVKAIPARLKAPYPFDDLFWALFRRR